MSEKQNQEIRLRKEQRDILFPSKLTKVRREDLISLIVENKKILNEREFNALNSIIDNKSGYNEYYVKKKKNGIELIPFDED